MSMHVISGHLVSLSDEELLLHVLLRVGQKYTADNRRHNGFYNNKRLLTRRGLRMKKEACSEAVGITAPSGSGPSDTLPPPVLLGEKAKTSKASVSTSTSGAGD